MPATIAAARFEVQAHSSPGNQLVKRRGGTARNAAVCVAVRTARGGLMPRVANAAPGIGGSGVWFGPPSTPRRRPAWVRADDAAHLLKCWHRKAFPRRMPGGAAGARSGYAWAELGLRSGRGLSALCCPTVTRAWLVESAVLAVTLMTSNPIVDGMQQQHDPVPAANRTGKLWAFPCANTPHRCLGNRAPPRSWPPHQAAARAALG